MNRSPYPSLTAVVHGMVKAAPSGLDARTVADLVGKPYATLMSELSQQPGHKLGAELLLPLMDVCESDLPLVFLARQRGGAFVPLRLPDDGPVQLVTGLSVSIRRGGGGADRGRQDHGGRAAGDAPPEPRGCGGHHAAGGAGGRGP